MATTAYHAYERITHTLWEHLPSLCLGQPPRGTGITKFPEKDLPLYERAVLVHGKPDTWLNGLELHSAQSNMTKFWKMFTELRDNTNSLITHTPEAHDF
jgi:hypothetical protein